MAPDALAGVRMQPGQLRRQRRQFGSFPPFPLIGLRGAARGSYKFSVGDRLADGVLNVLLRLVDAAYSKDKEKILAEANGMLCLG